MTQRHVVFSHGKDSEPWGRKIIALADTARAAGCGVASIDYRGIDTVEGRLQKLHEGCRDLQGELVLVGSSLGGYLSAAAASSLRARGLFLMAPAFYLAPLPELPRLICAGPIEIVHGWRDDVVPIDNSLRFAREHRATLHVVDDDHRLYGSLGRIQHLLRYFLDSAFSVARG